MKNMKFWRTALVATLVLTVMLSVTGGTIAWFTDEVTSANNVVQSGNLDVEVYYSNNDTAWQNLEAAPLFNYELWEPGFAMTKGVKVVNEGNLAFKFKLFFQPAVESAAQFKLEDVIDVYVKDDAPVANRNDLGRHVGTLASLMNTDNAVHGMLTEKQEDVLYITLKMQESAGNDYQGLSVGEGFGIKLEATQATVESDSFGNDYDAGANFTGVWEGETPAEMPETLVVDGATQTIHVKDAAAFAYLSTLSEQWAELYTDGQGNTYTNYANGAGADYYYSSRWTVSLEADIDLQNYPMEPVVLVIGESTGASAFKGNNHVIRNINTTTGLFADNSRVTYADLTLENVKATNGALTGSSNTSISNVTVKNATISGTDYVGGLVGYIYGDVTGCKVIDSSVTASGKEAGGLIGYVASSSGEGKVTDNEVRNVSVFANNRAAGLVAQANDGVKVYNNTVDTVTVGASDTSKYQPDAVVSNAINSANVYDNTVKNAADGIEVYGLKLTLNADTESYGTITVSDKEGLLNLAKLNENWAALFSDGKGTAYSNYPVNNYYYSWTWNIVLTADIDFGGAQIQPINLGKRLVFDGKNHTIKNAKIVTDSTTENEAGLFVANDCGVKNLKLDNIQVTGSNVGNSTAGVLSGSCNAGVSNITVSNSSVTGGKYTGGVVGYGYTNVTDCTLNNVTVKGGYKLGGLIGYICQQSPKTANVTGNTLTNCTVKGNDGIYAGGKDRYIVGKIVGNYNANGDCKNNTITNMTTSATGNIGEIEAGLNVNQ